MNEKSEREGAAGKGPPPAKKHRGDGAAPVAAEITRKGTCEPAVSTTAVAPATRGAAAAMAGGAKMGAGAAKRAAVPAPTSNAPGEVVVQAAAVSKESSGAPQAVRKFTHPIVGQPESSFTKSQLERMPVAFAFRPDADGPTRAAALKAQERWNATWRAAGLVINKKPAVTTTTPKAKLDGGGAERQKRPSSRAPVETFHGLAPDVGPGWTLKKFKRMGGATGGREDRYWYSPREKLKFRSLAAIKRFKEALGKVGGEDEKAALRLLNG